MNARFSQREARLMHVMNAHQMLEELPPYTDDHRLPAVVQNACLESFFVNLRLLIDSLRSKGRKSDIKAEEFLPSWQPALGGEMDRLWSLASKHVVHLGGDRAPSAGHDAVENVHPQKPGAYAAMISAELRRLGEEMLANGDSLGSALAPAQVP